MNINFNIGFLKNVRQPIIESLNETSKIVKENLSLVKEGKVLSGSALNTDYLEHIHKAKGALQMIGLSGLVLILSSCEELIKKLKEGSINDKLQQSFYAMDKFFTELVSYIDQLCAGEQDRPVRLYSHYESICTLLQKEHSKKDLFFPNIDLLKQDKHELDTFFKTLNNYDESKAYNLSLKITEIVKKHGLEKLTLEICATAEQIKQAYSNSTINQVASVVFVQSLQNQLTTLDKAVMEMQELKINKHWFIMTHIYRAFISCLMPNVNEKFIDVFALQTKSVKFNLLKISTEFSSLSKKISAEIDSKKVDYSQSIRQIKTDKNIQKELLFLICSYVSRDEAAKKIPAVMQLSDLIELDTYLELADGVGFSASAVQKDPEAVAYLDKLVIDLKDEFVLISSKTSASDPAAAFKKLNSIAQKISEQLVSVGLAFVKPLPLALCDMVFAIAQKKAALSDYAKEEMSIAINFLEKIIDAHGKSVVDLGHEEDSKAIDVICKRISLLISNGAQQDVEYEMPKLSKAASQADKNKINVQIFTQLSDDLVSVEEQIHDIFKSNGESANYEPIINVLNSARGILAVTGTRALSELLSFCVGVFKSLAQGEQAIKPEEVKQASNYVAGVILYVNALKNLNQQEAQSIANSLMVMQKNYNNKGVVLESLAEKENNQGVTKEAQAKPVFDKTVPLQATDFLSTVVIMPDETNAQKSSTVQAQEQDLGMTVGFDFSNLPSQEKKEVATVPVQENKDQDSQDVGMVFWDTHNNAELCEIFLMEAQEVVEQLEKDLVALRVANRDFDLFTTVKRAFHTLKGSARMVGLRYMAEAAWLVEQTLNKMIETKTWPESGLIDVLSSTAKEFASWSTTLSQTMTRVQVDLTKTQEGIIKFNPLAKFSFDLSAEASNRVSEQDVQKAGIGEQELSFETVNNSQVVDSVQPLEVVAPQELVFENNTQTPEQEISFGDVATDSTQTLPTLPSVDVLEVDFTNQHEQMPSLDVPQEAVELENNVNDGNGINFETPQELVPASSDSVVYDESQTVINVEDFVKIGDHEVSKELFELFDKESAEHIDNMFAFLSQAGEPLLLKEDFTRFAHTTNSICCAVQLLIASSIASKLESISVVGVDKQFEFSSEQKKTLLNAVAQISRIKNELIVEEDKFISQLIEKLDTILTQLNNYSASAASEMQALESAKELQSTGEPDRGGRNHMTHNIDTEQIVSRISQQILSNQQQVIEQMYALHKEKINHLESLHLKSEQTKLSLEGFIESQQKMNEELLLTVGQMAKTMGGLGQLLEQMQSKIEQGISANTDTSSISSQNNESIAPALTIEQVKEVLDREIGVVKEHTKKVMLNGLGIIRKDIQALAEKKKGFF